jgi:nucleoside-diphosphate-sugar epimerase
MTALVTGGGGFLGGAIVRKLLARGEAVRSFTRSCYPWLTDLGVEQIHGDLGSLPDVEKAVSGCGVVYHVAAKAGVWGRRADYFATNVTGTQNVIAACKSQGVRRLVYTSTPSVVHGGGDLEGANESVPYPKHFEAYYPETKAIAERAVLRANGPDLATVALRPHLIWGPGDPHLIPRVLARAKAGRLRRIGPRDVKVDVTYVDNAADAHVLAADKLAVGSPVAGKAYFISNGEPVVMWDFLNRVITDAGLPPVTRTVPVWIAKTAGRVLEWVYWLLRLSGEPPMTRFVADQLSTSHWYDITAAKRDLGYVPAVSTEEGLRRLKDSLTRETPALTV